jgi:hypothetical protein
MSSHSLTASLSGTTTKSGDCADAFDLIRAALPAGLCYATHSLVTRVCIDSI